MGVKVQIIRLLVSSIVGFIMGIERAKGQKTAGVGTFSVICISSCFLTLVSAYGISSNTDPSRLIANIITAIGFVAGGTIFTVNSGNVIKVNGLTTGAEIFCVAALGIGVGLGLYGIVITVIILVEINIFFAKKIKMHYKKANKLQIAEMAEEEDNDILVDDDIY